MTFQKGRVQGQQETAVSVHVGPHSGVQFVDEEGYVIFEFPPDRMSMLHLGHQIITAALEMEETKHH